LLTDIAELMMQTARQTQIEFSQKQWRVKMAHAPEDLEVRVRYLGAGGGAVTGFPLKLSYKGIENHNGWNFITDQEGRIRWRAGIIPTTTNRLISLRAEMNIEALSQDAPHWRWMSLLPPAQRPSAEMPIEILPSTVEIKISGAGDLSGWSSTAMEQIITARLGKNGLLVWNGQGRPDFQLVVQIDCRAIQLGSTQSSGILNGSIKLSDAAQMVRYQQSLNEVRSTGPDSPSALRAAQKRMQENLELSVLPRVLERILHANTD
jgi:hypothetical protein